jgi:eukaryotic-like serine/threonine-protein kinase
MDGDPRVRQLLEDLLDSDVTPEEVCRHCPELLSQVRLRWERKRVCEAQLDLLFPSPDAEDAFAKSPATKFLGELPEIPGYEVQEVLGHGGMGVVYRARHIRLNRSIAVKMLLNGVHASSESRERFLREAKAVAGLRHPSIVQVHDMGDLNGQPYFTMEFVEGGTLAQKLAGTPQASRHAASLLEILADAVQAAHQNGIVHRDLKPANILLTADGAPKISDFGLARRLDGEAGLTWTGATLGTPSYMAPEQAEGRPILLGPAVDIYALGAILYELLTGRPPFRAESAALTVRQVLCQDAEPPSRLNGKVPRDLEVICLKCLRRDPQLRYASAAALTQDLRHFLQGEAIAARPEGRWARWGRRIRRHPFVSMAAASGLLLAMATLGGQLWLLSDREAVARKIESERMIAEQAAGLDLREMGGWLRKSDWPQAEAALQRAKGRLGGRESAELRPLVEQGSCDLEVAARLGAILIDVARTTKLARARANQHYEEAFRDAGIGSLHDDPTVVAERIRASDIQIALVGALDHWSGCLWDVQRRNWVLAVARRADPDPTGWRDRARDPATWESQSALVRLVETAPVADGYVPLFVTLEKQLTNLSNEQCFPFLRRVQQAHPGDFWINLRLGDALIASDSSAEAIRYYQAAVSILPKVAFLYQKLGWALWTERREEAVACCLKAVELDPSSDDAHYLLSIVLTGLGRNDEAIDHLQAGIRLNPGSARLHAELGRCFELLGREVDALTHYQQAAELDPRGINLRRRIRSLLAALGREDEALAAWRETLAASPRRHADWFGYAEFCLFLGRRDDYLRARQALLAAFESTADPSVAERVARACLLLPMEGEELQKAVALAERAVAVDPSRYGLLYSMFQFAKGLAEYREGKFSQAIATMRGGAAQINWPGPGLVLAMALHQSGQELSARRALATAMLSHDWRPSRIFDQNDWAFHAIRREAEQMILPDLQAFLAGKHQPRDNDERLALLGLCQATNRTGELARLYADAFADSPQLANDPRDGHRYRAACAAAQAGTGKGAGAVHITLEDRRHWRDQARIWLEADLAEWKKLGNAGGEMNRKVRQELNGWLTNADFAGLRDPVALMAYSAEERNEWLGLWEKIRVILNRPAGV